MTSSVFGVVHFWDRGGAMINVQTTIVGSAGGTERLHDMKSAEIICILSNRVLQ